MKYLKILRWFGVLTVLSLLMAVVPAAPALAAESLLLNPTQVKVGDRVNYSGAGYTPSGTSDYYIDLYLSDQAGVITNIIDTNITRYKKVVFGAFIDEAGAFSGYFTMPTTLNEGTVGAATPLTITAGVTYYVFATNRYNDPNTPGKSIRAVATVTVTPGATLDALSPASGQPGTAVSLTGANFPASTTLVIQFDGAAITPASGDTATRSSGLFITNITIPANAAAGAHTITVTAGTGTATGTFTVIAPATLTLSPTTGAPGAQVAMSGANFPAGTIAVTFDAAPIAISAGSAQAAGGVFASFIIIPATAAAGPHTIAAAVGATSASANFTVTGTTPTPTPTPTATPTPTPTTTPPTTTPPATSTGKGVINVVQNGTFAGATIGIGGSGFNPNATVTVKWDDKDITSTKVSTDSTFQIIFKVPSGAHGDRKLTVTDGTNTVIKTFTVESTAPKVPPPLRPQSGAKVKEPIVFTWGTVTDDSLPVVYHLQIATERTFGASSLVLDKTAIESTSYTLTDAEELKLAPKSTPYYWRVQSIDAAANASDWTGAGDFSVSGPFVFPKWGMYAAIIGGAIVLFLIGFLVGRRTAFYY